jgi:hypothetical protein
MSDPDQIEGHDADAQEGVEVVAHVVEPDATETSPKSIADPPLSPSAQTTASPTNSPMQSTDSARKKKLRPYVNPERVKTGGTQRVSNSLVLCPPNC